MRKTWMEPQIEVEQFMANEYVSACGDSGTVYKFVCEAGGGRYGDVYDDNDKNLTPGWLSSYHACGKTHEAPVQDEFISGTFRPLGTAERIPVIIWTENGTNVHCTTNLDKEDWEITKS